MDSDIDHPYLRSQLTILGHKLRWCLFFRVAQVGESHRLWLLESIILVRNSITQQQAQAQFASVRVLDK